MSIMLVSLSIKLKCNFVSLFLMMYLRLAAHAQGPSAIARSLNYLSPFKFRLLSILAPFNLGPFNFRPPVCKSFAPFNFRPHHKLQSIGLIRYGVKIQPQDVLGHIPREISCFFHFFLYYGSALESRVRSRLISIGRRLTIPKDGLDRNTDCSDHSQ